MDCFRRSIPVLLGTGALLVAAGCCHCPTQAQVVQPRPMAPAPVVAPAPTPVPVAAPAPVKAEPATPAPIVIKSVGLQTPECVYWDAEQDAYFVSNINGDPTAADQNGFISKIGPDGKVIELKWIDGSKKSSELNAPKGILAAGNILYVADLDTVRKFDRQAERQDRHQGCRVPQRTHRVARRKGALRLGQRSEDRQGQLHQHRCGRRL
jgi:hypothetical protein